MHFHIELNQIFAVVCLVHVCVVNIEAGILPLTWLGPHSEENKSNSKMNSLTDKFGYIEYKPNGTLILRSTLENGTNAHNLLLLRSILGAIRVSAPFNNAGAAEDGTSGVKIYGDGVEHKFPPFLEHVIQRIQSYFSVYKYTDTSRPYRPEAAAEATTPPYGGGAGATPPPYGGGAGATPPYGGGAGATPVSSTTAGMGYGGGAGTTHASSTAAWVGYGGGAGTTYASSTAAGIGYGGGASTTTYSSTTATVEGSGGGGAAGLSLGAVSLQSDDDFVDAAVENEFIALGRNFDGYILTVVED